MEDCRSPRNGSKVVMMPNNARLTTLGLILWMGLSAHAQTLNLRLPAPTGKHSVGRTTFFWADAARSNRLVRVDVWYPAGQSSGKVGEYFPDLEALARNPSTGDTIARFFGGDLQRLRDGRVESNAYTDAPVAREGKPFPALLFSHGLGQSPFTYSIQLEELASHGYIVLGLTHIGDAVAISLPGGNAVPFDASFWEKPPPSATEARQSLFAEDLVFALNQMAALSRDSSSAFYGAIDLDRIGAFGHSSGGRIAAGACILDSRIRACLNQDGGLHRPDWPSPGRAFRGAFAILDWFDPAFDAQDYAGMRTTPSNYARQVLRPVETAMEIWRQPEQGSYRITLLKKGMLHTAFTDMRWLTATSDANRARFMDYLALIREVTRAFFDQTLDGRSSPLLSCTPNEADLLVQCYARENANLK